MAADDPFDDPDPNAPGSAIVPVGVNAPAAAGGGGGGGGPGGGATPAPTNPTVTAVDITLIALGLAVAILIGFLGVLLHVSFGVPWWLTTVVVVGFLAALLVFLNSGNPLASFLQKNVAFLLVPALVIGYFVVKVDFSLPADAAPSIPVEAVQLHVPATAEQLVVVSAPAPGATDATLQAFERDEQGGWQSKLGPFSAHLGRSGFHADRREGDGSTPSGSFDLTEAFGINGDPGTRMPYRKVGPNDWWVSDSTSPFYNTYQTHEAPVPWNAARGEHLITFGRAYNYAVAIGFNMNPTTPGLGSAIFLHVDTGNPTSGCVSISEDAMVSVLKWLDPAKRPRIVMGEERLLLRAVTSPPVTAGASGGLAPVEPKRLLDTRQRTSGLGERETLDLVVAGGTTGVPADAVAVALNVTLTEQTAAEGTYLTVYPTPANPGEGPPLVSNVNGVKGEHRANLVIASVGAGRQVRIFNFAGRSHVVVDVVGYIAPAAGERFQSVPSYRILDTREDSLKGPRPAGALPGGTQFDLPVPFVPSGATAAVVNVTAVDPSADTWFAAWKGGTPYGNTSTVNTRRDEDSANLAIVPLAADGTIRLRNANQGQAHLVVDVQGFLMPTSGSRFVVARTPVRVLDTRDGVGVRGIVGGGEFVRVRIAGLPADATAVAVTITGVDASAGTFLRASGGDGTSNVNLDRGTTRANLAIVPVVDGTITITNHSGSVHVVADVTGWFAPA